MCRGQAFSRKGASAMQGTYRRAMASYRLSTFNCFLKMNYMTIRSITLIFLCGWLAVMSVSCKKTQLARVPAEQTTLQYIAQDTTLTLMNAAITHCHLDTLFSSGGP